MKKFFCDFRIVDCDSDFLGSVFVENNRITEIFPSTLDIKCRQKAAVGADAVFSGGSRLVLMPGFIDMHAHFRTPGFQEKETLESACLSAVRGGWTSSVCMANTNPPVDNISLANWIKKRADEIMFINLYPVLSLTKGMKGKTLSDIKYLKKGEKYPPLFSEDGNDIKDAAVFLEALNAAAKLQTPVSCHCDRGGERKAVGRVINLGVKSMCHIHIAHVSTDAAVSLIRNAKKTYRKHNGFRLTCEVTPHHIALNNTDALRLGISTYGKVAPALGSESDRRALIEALRDGTIDIIATDHAPHTNEDKEKGANGFTGFETAFPVLYTNLIRKNKFSLSSLSQFLSASPAKILGLKNKGRIRKNYCADIAVVDIDKKVVIKNEFFSRGKNSPFIGRNYYGEVAMTISGGRLVYER
ncbi:MAG: dihydroorotase [Spirochaetaceae bacterium]|jgi:dihydroorotase|nr:dihydroorotase [Spirochaetaceae bacterium]